MLTVPDISSSYFRRRTSIVYSMASYHVRKITIKGCRDRITITLKTGLMMKPSNMPRINMIISHMIPTWNPLRKITIYSLRNYGCPTSDG